MEFALIKGTFEINPNMDGFVITSESAIAEGAEDVPLQRGDAITINGDVFRGDVFIANIY